MLFKVKHLEGIKNGRITLAFRKWKRPRVLKGSLIKSPIGQIEILNINSAGIDQISKLDAALSGIEYGDLIATLNSISQGNIYKIELKYHSLDPRLILREQSEISDTELEQIKSKLKKYDLFSKRGDWTLLVLQSINDHPKTRAIEIATALGFPKDWLKSNIRRLKNLGLTISHQIGYSLSPRGIKVLEKLREN